MKKVICIAMVVALIVIIFCGPLAHPANAFAASVAIVGAVVAVMAISGITLIAAGVTSDQIKNYVGNKLDEWASSMGSPLDHLINSAGIGVTISGLLTIGTEAYSGIRSFIQWLQNDEGITQGNTIQVISPATGNTQVSHPKYGKF